MLGYVFGNSDSEITPKMYTDMGLLRLGFHSTGYLRIHVYHAYAKNTSDTKIQYDRVGDGNVAKDDENV